MNLFVTCTRYLESLLAEEVQALGATEVSETRAGISCSADAETAYRIVLWSRLASRVLLMLYEGEAGTEQALYDSAAAVPWEEHFSPRSSFAVTADAVRSPITNTAFAALKVKDAVADRFRARAGRRPSVDTEDPDIRIRVHLNRDRALFYLDLSGESLHRRGYRTVSTQAPLRETAAAGVLLRAGWPAIAREGGSFSDPMCGSGTLPIEAAMLAGNIAPALLRERYGFRAWLQHDEELWSRLRAEARERRKQGIEQLPPIYAGDIDAEAVEAARQNILQAGLTEVIQLQQGDFRQYEPLQEPAGAAERGNAAVGLIAVNPPYGHRLQERSEAAELYEALGRWLSERCDGFRAAVLAPEKETAKRIGLRAEKLNTLYNGNLKIYLATFDIGPRNRFVPSRPEEQLPAPDDDPTSGVNTVINRLKKNRRGLKSYLKKQGVSCYRIYDADIPQYAAAVDVYEERYFVVQEYAPPKSVDPQKALQHLRELQGALVHYYGAEPGHIYLKQRRRQRGTAQYERSGEAGERYIVREGGLKFFVNFTDYLDTGLFLDHRPTRSMLRDWAQDCRFLNLFAYTCTASVYAAAGNAEMTVSVDTSNTYLEWGKQNFRLNGLPPEQHRFIRRDVFDFLRSDTGHYELIFLDPPTFSNRKGADADFEVGRDYPLLIDLAMARLSPGGTLLFSTNFRGFSPDAEITERYAVREVSADTIPPDFSRNASIHRSFLIRLR